MQVAGNSTNLSAGHKPQCGQETSVRARNLSADRKPQCGPESKTPHTGSKVVNNQKVCRTLDGRLINSWKQIMPK